MKSVKSMKKNVSSQLKVSVFFKETVVILEKHMFKGLGVFCANSQLSEGMEVWETKTKKMHW